MAKTSSTEAMAISSLKHLNGIPLCTTTTLVGLRVAQHTLMQAAPRGLPRSPPHARAREAPSGTSSGAPLKHNAIFVYIEIVSLNGATIDVLQARINLHAQLSLVVEKSTLT